MAPKRKATDVDDAKSNLSPIKFPRRSERIRDKCFVPCNLMDLNDDCLLKIFAHLSEIDLNALNKSCRRLKLLTEDFLRVKYKDKSFELTSSIASHQFMRNFGQILTRLKIDYRYLDKTRSDETILYKNFTNLRELIVVDLKFSCKFVTRTKALCQNLKSLSIASFTTKVGDNILRRFMQSCTQLESLNVYARPNKSISIQFLAHHYPAMKELSIRKYYNASLDYQRTHIQTFLEKNPQIEKVTFDFQATQIDSKVLVDILNYSPNIKSIQLRLSKFDDSFATDLGHLHRLNNLVELNVNIKRNGGIIGAAIEALATTDHLETLGLSRAKFDDELVTALCKLTKLTTLKLNDMDGINSASVKKLSDGQRSLIQLHFVQEDELDFHDVLCLVEHFPQWQSLTYTHCKLNYWNEDLLDADGIVDLINARRCSNAPNPLTVFMHPETMIYGRLLRENNRYIRLANDPNLSYATQLD